jgi:hypothetical protein
LHAAVHTDAVAAAEGGGALTMAELSSWAACALSRAVTTGSSFTGVRVVAAVARAGESDALPGTGDDTAAAAATDFEVEATGALPFSSAIFSM